MACVRLLVAFSLLLSLSGGHWAFLQAVAWSEMAVRYSAAEGWVRGLWKTLSGEAPCALCRSIAKESQKERLPESGGVSSRKLEMMVQIAKVSAPRPPCSQVFFGLFENAFPSRRDPPPSPPPRVV